MHHHAELPEDLCRRKVYFWCRFSGQKQLRGSTAVQAYGVARKNGAYVDNCSIAVLFFEDHQNGVSQANY